MKRPTFYGCSGLTSVTFPSRVTSISERAFSECSGLMSAIFLGEVPVMGYRSFGSPAPGFTVYYLNGTIGFTTPTWEGFPAFPLDAPPTASETWLLGHGYPLDTDLHQDLNGDGVSLFMAYSLNLNANKNLAGSLPVPMVDGDKLTMNFYGIASGISYRVETSTNLRDWTIEGVGVTDAALDGTRKAIVSRDSPHRFLRLVVE